MTKISLRLAVLFSLIWFKVSAQECDCLSYFQYTKNHIETNNPAFQRIKNNSNEHKIYQKQVKRIAKLAKKEISDERCIIHLEQYFLLLKDNHSGVGLNISRLPLDFSSQSSIDSFKLTKNYQSFEKLRIDTTALITELKSKPINDIEGIYTNGGSLYFGIIKSKKNHYKGIILRKTSLLDVGHILMDIRKIDNATFDFTLHYGLLAFNFQNIYKKIKPEHGKINELGFTKLGAEKAQEIKPYEFQAIDIETNYLRISSFHIDLKEELTTFYQSIDSSIQNKPYLIIDLRDNGGGADDCYIELLKYIYTKPFTIDLADVWVSPDNIKKYENAGHSKELIDRMKNAEPFTFIPQTQNAITKWESTGTSYPQKVALIFNKKTASSAEGMILYGMQSEKVITLGENSGGYLGYGNVKSEIIPCGKYVVYSTTTRYLEKSKFEFIGISPQIKLNERQDWIKSAAIELQKQ
jgi:hypothetical protein